MKLNQILTNAQAREWLGQPTTTYEPRLINKVPHAALYDASINTYALLKQVASGWKIVKVKHGKSS